MTSLNEVSHKHNHLNAKWIVVILAVCALPFLSPLWTRLSIQPQKIENQPVSAQENPQDFMDDHALLNSTVIVHVACDDPRYEDYGLGTVISDRTVITAKHVVGMAIGRSDIPGLRFNDLKVTGLVDIRISYYGDQGKKSGTDIIRIDLPATYAGLLPAAARLASQDTIDSIKAGDWVSIVYYDYARQQKAVGRFRVLEIVDGMAMMDDPAKLIAPGDSGGGVYYDGLLIGTTSSIMNAVPVDNPDGPKQYMGLFWITFITPAFR